jgi:hypothetical protein
MTERLAALDELEAAHNSVGGTGPGRRHTTQQINQAYAVLLSSQFQGLCRDLHDECVNFLIQNIPSAVLQTAIHKVLVENRKLDRGNPNPANFGADYNRFGLDFWTEVRSLDLRNRGRQDRLEELNVWRNAIANHDFDPAVLGATVLGLQEVRGWRSACNQLASCFDEVMRLHIHTINGVTPW